MERFAVIRTIWIMSIITALGCAVWGGLVGTKMPYGAQCLGLTAFAFFLATPIFMGICDDN